ncbi:MAG: tetratricopeptide repeat protein [Bacteroidia bacterium]|jgi:tetratricopeptide (TPR) repeat protein|nr:tetratricopeptide repeat protein [Bacteroidia bacterium]
MARFGLPQWIALGSAAACFVLLSFVNTVPKARKAPEGAPQAAQSGNFVPLDRQVAEARKRLPAQVLARIEGFEKNAAAQTDFVQRRALLDSASRTALNGGEHVLAAFIAQKKAETCNGSSVDWQLAGERFQNAAAFQGEKLGPEYLGTIFESAIHCFREAVALDARNLDARVGLGASLVQGTSDPMAGIRELLEVEKADSANVNAQLVLGDFAVRSQQYDKAIARYTKALQLRPDLYGLNLSLAELYEQKGDTANTIACLEAYLAKADDPLVKNDVENAIRKLRSSK